MNPICFLDCETDGLHPGCQPYEIAMIRRDESGTRRIEFFVEIDLSTADPAGLRVGRFYDRHPLGRFLSGLDNSVSGTALSAAHAAQLVARHTHGATIVGIVPSFDTRVLAKLLRSQRLTPAWHYHLTDVVDMAAGWLHGAAAPVKAVMPESIREVLELPLKSEPVSLACGVEPPAPEERHTAMGDARWAMRLYDQLTGATDGGAQ